MPTLPLTPDQLLTTTRAVRKRLDFKRPVPLEVVKECLEIALQAPSGGNAQTWHFIVVTDAEKRGQLAALYRKSFDIYRTQSTAAGALFQQDPVRGPSQKRIMDSAEYLAVHMHEVPVMLIPCLEGRPPTDGPIPPLARGGSLFPAVWSFMLAARARGLGTVLTSLHLRHEREAAEVLGVRYERISQGGLVPVAYTLGTDFKPGRRQPLADVLHINGW
ncbi:MAG TPA: nitroreductase family protein [bacterium]